MLTPTHHSPRPREPQALSSLLSALELWSWSLNTGSMFFIHLSPCTIGSHHELGWKRRSLLHIGSNKWSDVRDMHRERHHWHRESTTCLQLSRAGLRPGGIAARLPVLVASDRATKPDSKWTAHFIMVHTEPLERLLEATTNTCVLLPTKVWRRSNTSSHIWAHKDFDAFMINTQPWCWAVYLGWSVHTRGLGITIYDPNANFLIRINT